MYNSAADEFDTTYKTNIVVDSSGKGTFINDVTHLRVRCNHFMTLYKRTFISVTEGSDFEWRIV